MSQEDYDSGYEDGRRSMDERIADLEEQIREVRADLAREQDEVRRYRAIVYRPVVFSDEVPF